MQLIIPLPDICGMGRRIYRDSSSSCFQPGEGPSRGLLRDYEPSDGTFSSTSHHHHHHHRPAPLFVSGPLAAILLTPATDLIPFGTFTQYKNIWPTEKYLVSAVDIARWRAAVDEYFVNTMGSARWGPGRGRASTRILCWPGVAADTED